MYHYITLFTFTDPPKVNLNMEVLKVPLGERVSINCSVTGSPPPTIMWKRFDENIQTGK